jgi:hypothetical protein
VGTGGDDVGFGASDEDDLVASIILRNEPSFGRGLDILLSDGREEGLR